MGGEGLKIKGIGVKARVKANQAVARYFSVSGEGSEGKKRGIIV